MLFTEHEIVCPRGRPGGHPLVIDLGPILASEKRQDEVATVTKFKAPELLAEFNRSWRDLHKVLTQLVMEQNTAERNLERRKAILLLEVVPVTLAAKKLSSNDAHRDAVVILDPDHQVLQETCDQIAAAVEFLKGKLKSFENAYNSVKKIMGEDIYSMGSRGSNSNLTGDTNTPSEVNGADVRKGWGKARY